MTTTTAATGPQTAEGKAASSRNALRHGLTAALVLIPGEDPSEYNELVQYLVDAHQPAPGLETVLVDQIAQCTWRLNRARRLEREALELDLTSPSPELSHRVEKITRYMATIEREFHRAIRELTALQTKRADTATAERKTASRETSAELDKALHDYINRPLPQLNLKITKRTPEAAPQKSSLRSQMPDNLALCL